MPCILVGQLVGLGGAVRNICVGWRGRKYTMQQLGYSGHRAERRRDVLLERGRTWSGRDEGKQRRTYDIDGLDVPVFGGESGKVLCGFRPVLAPNFVPTSKHMALASSAGPSFVNDNHALPVVSVTMNANSTGLVIGEKAADDCRGV
jgi:hypothetical protein